MKIVFCTSLTTTIGGMERVLSQRVNYLVDKYNYDIYIITTEYSSKKIKNKINTFF